MRLETTGFNDLAMDGQAAFRVLLQALSRPCRKFANPADCAPPPPLSPTTAAIALCLIDRDVPVWLDETLKVTPVTDFLRFQTDATLCADPRHAGFALIGRPATMPRLEAFNAGSAFYPEHSTTLVLQLATLDHGPAIDLAGPGIERRESIGPAELPPWFWDDWSVNGRLYPRGVDIVMTDDRHFLGLPRTCCRIDR